MKLDRSPRAYGVIVANNRTPYVIDLWDEAFFHQFIVAMITAVHLIDDFKTAMF